MDDTSLPYAGTSGWSGSDTSRERAERDDGDGTTSKRQRLTLTLLDSAGRSGLTWRELSRLTGWHHGQASGVLSVLHLDDRIVRLEERRGRCAVYTTRDHVDGRAESVRALPKAVRLLRIVEEACLDLEEDGHDECADMLRRRVSGI